MWFPRRFIKKNYPILLVLPAFLTIFFLVAYPLLITLRASFYDWTFGKIWETASYVGLSNYEWMLGGGDYFLSSSIQITLIFVVVQVILSLALGLAIALLISRVTRGRSIIATAFIIPMVVMPAVVGLIFRLYFSYDGLVNYFLGFAGIKINWYSTGFALMATTITMTWITTPFFVLVFYAGLMSLPREPFEAAKVDGASRWQVFKDITLPLMKPVILIATIMRTIEAFRIFDLPYTMFGGGPGSATNILAIHISRVAFSTRYLGRGSCLSLLLVLIVLISCLLLVRSLTRAWRGGK